MTNPHHQRRQWYWYGLQLGMTHFMWPYRHATITKTCYNTQIHTQNLQLKWLPILVAIATDHVFTSDTESPCFCCYWQHLTTNGAGIWLQLIHFCLFTGVHSVRNVTVATSTSLPSPRRSYRGHCHPGQPYHVHILCILGSVIYFSVFKLWFTLRASASVEAPESPTVLDSRLWKRVLGN